MSIEIEMAERPTPVERRGVLRAMGRGLKCRCPACGTGALYGSYLKVAHACPVCGTELHHQRADDAPPYFTMLIVGHIVVGGVLWLERWLAPSLLVQALIWIPATIGLSMALLPSIKGALVALQWAMRMHGFGSGPDPAAPLAPGGTALSLAPAPAPGRPR